MREIKFRAKSTEGLSKGKWVFGIPYRFRNTLYMLPLSNIFVSKEAGDLVFGDYYPISKNTLGQFLGIKDKNKKEVYEGDIVEAVVEFITDWPFGHIIKEKIVGVVEKTDDGCWQIRTHNKYMPIIGSYAVVRIIKVVGNIYENRELLSA